MRSIARGDGSAVAKARRTIVRDAAEWRALWAAHAGPVGSAPPVDFGSEMVAAVFAGERPTPGHAIEIAGSRRDGSTLTLIVAEHAPSSRMATAQVLVSPFHIVALPRDDGEVRFADRPDPPAAVASLNAGAHTAPRPSRRVAPRCADAPSSTGLDPNFAAALAYLAGPFSGILILLVERANGYVRFHAWQAVIGLGGLGALGAATLVCSFLTLLLSPLAFTVMYRLAEAIAIVWVVAWLVCLVKAFTGRAWKMPVAGRYAERLAARYS